MASFAALESRRRSTKKYQASWLEHRVRQVSRGIRPVTPLPFLPVTQVQFISSRGDNVRFHLPSGPITESMAITKSQSCRDRSKMKKSGLETASISKNAVSFSSACTTRRFSSPRCASTIEIVRPSESRAETQPQFQPDLLRLSAISRG